MKINGKDYDDSVLNVITVAVVTVVMFALGIIAYIAVGYVIGMFIAIIPYVSNWMTEGIALDKEQIPTVTAWIALAALFLKLTVGSNKTKEVK